MTIINKIEFIIDHIDPLGQGVYKKDDQIYFIPKTLPGEMGIARIMKKRKGVHFCIKESLAKESDKRIDPLCEHFENCNGCHFLHTDYQTEVNSKLNSFKRMLTSIQNPKEIEVIKSENRAGYRNRIQLHYHKKARVLGFVDPKSRKIVPVPNCIICLPSIKEKISELYKDNYWLELAPTEPRGHVEIYESPTGLKVTWNSRYAEGGFTQVNTQMNEKMKDYLIEKLNIANPNRTLDLFGGGGNLSSTLDNKTVVDIYNQQMPDNFISINLHEEGSLSKFKSQNSEQFDTFIIDPPRAGFPQINDWVEEYSPKHIFYISCHPQTMIRDLKDSTIGGVNSQKYDIKNVVMLDLFPSTFHFEALIYLSKKEL